MSIIESAALTYQVGIIKPSRYLINFSGPANLIPARANIRLSVTCETAVLPGKAVATTEERLHGPQRRIPYVTEFPNEFTLGFRVGKDMYEKRVFEEWMEFIVDNNSHDFEYYNNYVQTLDIMQLSDSIDKVRDTGEESGIRGFLGNIVERARTGILTNLGINDYNNKPLIRIGDEIPLYTARIFEVFPVSVQEMPLSHATANEYSRIDVTFAYRNWQSIPDLTPDDIAATGPISYQENQATRPGTNRVIDIAERAADIINISNNGQILDF